MNIELDDLERTLLLCAVIDYPRFTNLPLDEAEALKNLRSKLEELKSNG